MRRREFVINAGVVGAGLAAGCRPATDVGPVKAESRRPNLVLLVTDDQRWDTLGCMGNPVIRTPRLDALASEGVVFENAFVTTSICPTSRATIVTGQHMRTHGVRDFRTPIAEDGWQNSYPSLLRAAGYRTGFIGKWGIDARSSEHLARPALEFDEWLGFPGQGDYFHDEAGRRRHNSAVLADRAIEFVGSGPSDQPFCLSVSFKSPHYPWHEFDPALAELYREEEIPLPASARETGASTLPALFRDSLGGVAAKRNPVELQKWLRDYYRLISGVDGAVGRILDALAGLGLADETVILFTSDNGHLFFEHAQVGKWLMYEESIRVPMILKDPRADARFRGARRSEMVLNLDCAPTLLGLAGVKIPASMQGRDISAFLRGDDEPRRESWFYEHAEVPGGPDDFIPGSVGLRTEEWKYVRYGDGDASYEQLFDLAHDPLEQKNLAGEVMYARRLTLMREELAAFAAQVPARPRVDAG